MSQKKGSESEKRLNAALPPDAPDLLAQVGENIKLARIARNMKQSELAERAGVSAPTLRKLEAGKPNVSFAVVLGVLGVLGLAATVLCLASPKEDKLGNALKEGMLRSKKRVASSKRDSEDLDF